MDTNLCMIREGLDLAGDVDKWKRGANQRITNSDIVKFPHAVLEIKLSL